MLPGPLPSCEAGRLPPSLNEQKVEWSASYAAWGPSQVSSARPSSQGALSLEPGPAHTRALPPSSFPDSSLLSSPSPPVSPFFTSPFLSPPRAACFSLLFLSSVWSPALPPVAPSVSLETCPVSAAYPPLPSDLSLLLSSLAPPLSRPDQRLPISPLHLLGAPSTCL